MATGMVASRWVRGVDSGGGTKTWVPHLKRDEGQASAIDPSSTIGRMTAGQSDVTEPGGNSAPARI